MRVEQRVELGAEGAKPTSLYLDQLAVGADQIDHEAVDGHLETVTGLRQ